MRKKSSRAPLAKSSPRRTGISDQPEWLQKTDLVFLRTGKLNLSSIALPDLSAIKARPSLKELNLSKTQLKSLQGLAVQRNIVVFTADNSHLESFANFSAIASASTYSLKNTPLAANRLFRVAIAILSNAPKPIVNGALISDAERKRAAAYPPFTAELLDLGWPIVWPCPEPDYMREYCRQYNVTYVEDSPADAEAPAAEPDVEKLIGGTDYLEQIEWLMGQHDEVIMNATRRFELLDESEERFQGDVRDLLEKRTRWTFAESEDLDEQILAAVTALCLGRGNH
jgi:hypothetical protein